MAEFFQAKLTGIIDKVGVDSALDIKEKKVLFQTAAYARTTMKRGMRRKKGPGKKDGYPAAHAGGLKDHINFVVNQKEGSATIGPRIFNEQPAWLPAGIKNIPELINAGGVVAKDVVLETGHVLPKVLHYYEPRPFATLPLEQSAERMRQIYKNTPLKK